MEKPAGNLSPQVIIGVLKSMMNQRVPVSQRIIFYHKECNGQEFTPEQETLVTNLLLDRDMEIPKAESVHLEFPDVMGGVAGFFSSLYSAYLESPELFFYLSYLTILGSIVSKNLRVNSELLIQPRLFVVLLGESADDRKSTSINHAVALCREVLNGDYLGWGACFGVGSAEGLQKRLEESSSLILIFDEFKQLISKGKIDGSILIPCINSLFEQNHYESRTQKSVIVLRDVHLSLLTASTIQTYERTWDPSFTDIGFNNRLFIVPGSGERRFSFPQTIPVSEKQEVQDMTVKILKHSAGLRLDITKEGRERYDEWYFNQEHSIHAKRLDTYALRFMALLAVNELKTVIDEEVVDKSIRLMDWQLQVRKLHDPIDADSKMAAAEERIRRALAQGSKSDRDLKRAVHADRMGIWFYDTAIKNLLRSREIKFIKGEKKWGLR